MSADGSAISAALSEQLEDFGANVDDRALAFYPQTDLGNGERYRARFGDVTAESVGFGVLIFTGQRWVLDENQMTFRRNAHQVAKAISRREAPAIEADPPKGTKDETEARLKGLYGWASKTSMISRLDAMREVVRPYIQVPFTEWNARPDIFYCRNTALKLDPGGVQAIPHDRLHRITRMAEVDYDPEAQCPTFIKFIERALPNADVRLFVRRAFGACLTDSAKDQAIIVFHGGGANGKSTLLDAVCYALGDYAMTADVASLLYAGDRPGSAPSPDIARLADRPRLVRASEPELGARLNEAHVKSITGGEPIVARKLHKDPFEFRPNFKIFLSCNSRPSIRGGDDGIWRRIMLVKWSVQIPADERDADLAAKLRNEAPGILNWLIRGWEDWLEIGLAPPPEVLDATKDYREDSDALGRFILEWCEKGDGLEEDSAVLHAAFEIWCRAEGSRAPNSNIFGRRLTDRGIEKRKSHGKTYRTGIALSTFGRDAMQQLELTQFEKSSRSRAQRRDDDNSASED